MFLHQIHNNIIQFGKFFHVFHFETALRKVYANVCSDGIARNMNEDGVDVTGLGVNDTDILIKGLSPKD